MCGLFGAVINRPLTEDDLVRARTARDSLTHRGPDQAGEWHGDGLYIGHRRLSIIDTSEAGRQPMMAGNIAITVNGEIYNFKDLRRTLEGQGHVFISQSDSEVVLHGFRQWGIDGLAERLEGMYAAVVAKLDSGEIFALRDRVGIKPLYYYHDASSFVWASELKAIASFLGHKKLDIAPEAIVDFLTYKYIPSPRSLYRNTYKLPPGSVLRFGRRHAQPDIRSYWQLPLSVRSAPAAELSGQLTQLLEESVHEQLVSDVPLGLLLSGGIDSSAIATYATADARPLHSFSIGFDGKLDETPFAQEVADHCGTTHHVRMFDASGLSDIIARMAELFDEPFGDPSALPTLRVCEFARESVTVALSGDGGDELFGGYNRYNRFESLVGMRGLFPILPDGWRRSLPKHQIPGITRDPVQLYAELRGALPRKRLQQWKHRMGVARDYDQYWAYRKHFLPDAAPRRNARVIDFHTYLPDDILTKVDRTSMAVSLECRPPFLSRPLVEFAFGLPEDFVFLDDQLKGGLKKALEARLPHRILHRPKKGFGIPVRGWKKKVSGHGRTLEEAMAQHFLEGGKAK